MVAVHLILRLWSSSAVKIGVLVVCLNFYIQPPVSVVLLLMLYLMSYYFVRAIFVVKDVSRMIFKGGILGGMHHFFFEGGASQLKQYYRIVYCMYLDFVLTVFIT